MHLLRERAGRFRPGEISHPALYQTCCIPEAFGRLSTSYDTRREMVVRLRNVLIRTEPYISCSTSFKKEGAFSYSEGGLRDTKRRYVSVCLAVFVLGMLVVPGMALAKPSGRGPAAPPSGAAWTYAIYMDGDNNLETYWDGYSLPMLQAVPASASVNIVAFVDLGSTSGMDVVKISGATVTTVLTAPEMNMGDPATLTWCIDRAAALFPSTNLVLSMWDHGYAWNYVCADDTSGDSLSMPELQIGIANAGEQIDILAFDCCNMGNIEVAYQVSLTGLVSYMVASEETVPGNGFPYDLMLGKLVSNPAMSPRDFSMAMVDAFGEYYATQTWASTVNLAAIDVVQLRASISTFVAWSADMQSLLPGYRAAYATALKNAYYMWGTHFFTDLYDYGYHLLRTKGVNDATLRADTAAMQNAVMNYCIKVWDGRRMTDCVGISLYWGTGNQWASHAAAYMQLAFAVDTGWGAFLTAYNA